MAFPIIPATKYEATNAGTATNRSSKANCPKILTLDIPRDSSTAISFFLAFIHRNSNSETTSPANIREPPNSLLAMEYIPEIDCCNAG